MKRFGLVVVMGLALASCGDDAAEIEERNEDSTARGEVLGGTISDDMLPLDTLTSQSPSQGGEQDEGDGEGTSSSPSPQDTSDASPQPAPEPEAAADPEPEAEPEEETAG